jgi:hypothetical protein
VYIYATTSGQLMKEDIYRLFLSVRKMPINQKENAVRIWLVVLY